MGATKFCQLGVFLLLLGVSSATAASTPGRRLLRHIQRTPAVENSKAQQSQQRRHHLRHLTESLDPAPIVVNPKYCRLSWGKVEGIPTTCYRDLSVFNATNYLNGPTTTEGEYTGVMDMLPSDCSCSGTGGRECVQEKDCDLSPHCHQDYESYCNTQNNEHNYCPETPAGPCKWVETGEVQHTGDLRVTMDSGVVDVEVTPLEGLKLYSFGLYRSKKEPVKDRNSWLSKMKSYPSGTTDLQTISFGSACNNAAEQFQWWQVFAVICDEAVVPPPVPESPYYCRESWGIVEGVAAKCFLDSSLFPTIGIYNGPDGDDNVVADGTYMGEMQQFPDDEACADAVTTGQLQFTLDCGMAEFYVTPKEGYAIYSLALHYSREQVQPDNMNKHAGKPRSFAGGSTRTENVAYGTATNNVAETFPYWAVSAVICDMYSVVEPPPLEQP